MSLVTFDNVLDIYNKDGDNVDDEQLWALLGASFFAAVMIIAFYTFGTIVLFKSTISESGLTYSYGALHMSSLWMAVLTLQCAVGIHAYKDRMKIWERGPNGATAQPKYL
jgi:hypothetical protein